MRNDCSICGSVLLHCGMVLLFTVALCFLFTAKTFASQDTKKDKITYLLNTIDSSHLVFIRSGTEYTDKEAKAHLQQELDFAGSSIRTVEDFITQIASTSLLTGTPYMCGSLMALKLKHGFGCTTL
jgi:hypothetical protein